MVFFNQKLEKPVTIKLIGLGGQGIVTTAALLARAAFQQGSWSQAMPFFGVERTGTPVEAYVRIANQPIRNRQKIEQPDILLINDYKLYQDNDHGRQLTIINQPGTITYRPDTHLLIYDSCQISLDIFGQDLAIGLLGGLNAVWPFITEKNWFKAIREHFANPLIIQKNQQAFFANQELVAKIIHRI
jgi:pyruvate ferredoxin oxidoreductase gamma subunit